MWKKEISKLEPTASMVHQAMPEFSMQKNVVILCGSWYAKKDLVCVVDEYANPDIICNTKHDPVIHDLALQPTGRKGRPAKHGKRLSPGKDFDLSNGRIGDYYMGVRRVLISLFCQGEVLAYVTASEKRFQVPVFQYHFLPLDAGILCLAGKVTTEPNRQQPYAVYPAAVLLFPVKYRSKPL